MRNKKCILCLSLSYVLLLLVHGCVGPLVPVIKLNRETAMRLRKEISIYEISQLKDTEFVRIAQVEATSCMNKIWDPPSSEEDALDQLRYKAAAMGANGLTNVICEKCEGTNLAKNCWNSVTCYGVAILLEPTKEGIKKQSQEISKSIATGFAITEDGYIVTANHTVEDAKKINVYLTRDKSVSAKVEQSDYVNDLVLLKIESRTPTFLKIAPMRSAKIGMKVFTIGFPVSTVLGREAKYTEGVISSITGIKDAATYLQITVPIQPGNSGGALVNEKGEVVGVITSTAAIMPFIQETGTLPQNVNWAVKADYIKPMIELPKCETCNHNREQIIENVRNATFLIEVEY